MPRADLTITLPDAVWVGRLSRQYPTVTFRVLSAMPAGETGVGLVEVVGGPIPEVLAAIAEGGDVERVDVLQRVEDRAVVQFETSEPMLLFSVRESGAPLDLPMEIRDGEAAMEITASSDRISALGRQLDAFGLRYELERIYRSPDPPDLLTERQRDLLIEAIDRGYYDTPRECTLTEFAEATGTAKSTVSEILHRAEGKVLKEFVAERYGHEPVTGG
ncbi:MAG: helix-turn-helix domain-containing protein [Haloarculaceae archaeon]